MEEGVFIYISLYLACGRNARWSWHQYQVTFSPWTLHRHIRTGRTPYMCDIPHYSSLIVGLSPYPLRKSCSPCSLFTAEIRRFCPDNFTPIKVGANPSLPTHSSLTRLPTEDFGAWDSWLPSPDLVDWRWQGGRKHRRRNHSSLRSRSKISISVCVHLHLYQHLHVCTCTVYVHFHIRWTGHI